MRTSSISFAILGLIILPFASAVPVSILSSENARNGIQGRGTRTTYCRIFHQSMDDGLSIEQENAKQMQRLKVYNSHPHHPHRIRRFFGRDGLRSREVWKRYCQVYDQTVFKEMTGERVPQAETKHAKCMKWAFMSDDAAIQASTPPGNEKLLESQAEAQPKPPVSVKTDEKEQADHIEMRRSFPRAYMRREATSTSLKARGTREKYCQIYDKAVYQGSTVEHVAAAETQRVNEILKHPHHSRSFQKRGSPICKRWAYRELPAAEEQRRTVTVAGDELDTRETPALADGVDVKGKIA